MLTRLVITNFLLIEQLELELHTGLTVVTGETGSGKSIIIDALMLLFGARAPRDIIRDGQKSVAFEAEFHLSNLPAIDWLTSNDLLDIDNPTSLICRRVIDCHGKNKSYINGSSVTNSQMKILSDYVLDIHTQHASITLLNPDMQRNLLDEYAQISPITQNLANVFKLINETKHKLDIARASDKELSLRRQQLADSITELSELGLKSHEWEELNAKHKQLANATNILSELGVVQTALQAEDISIIKQINQLNSRLSKIETYDERVRQLVELLNSVTIELKEVGYSIDTIAASIDQDPQLLTDIETRINHIFEVSRKYHILPEQIGENLATLQLELSSLIEDGDISKLEQTLVELEAQYQQLAHQISQARTKYAAQVADKVTQYLHQLSLTGEFKIELSALSAPSSYGLENVEYKVGFNKGMALQPLAKAASGGELSRTALALYLLLSMHNPPEIIIFDEIDVGIGGRVASKVGELLRMLGHSTQVICITHQPQTASYGDWHLVVAKRDNELGAAVTLVDYVVNDSRIDEIARMVGGTKITPTTLSHAREMLGIAT